MNRDGNSTCFLGSDQCHHGSAPHDVRIETDSLGEKAIPADVYWGIHTARARENFAITGRPISDFPDFIYAYACVKQAAARANAEIGSLPADRASLIDAAAEEIKQGGLRDQFVVDVIQGGAGTSTNMNVNEVIANRALEMAGHPYGAYQYLDPIDDVNRSQSTNDTYPTALNLASCIGLDRLLVALRQLTDALTEKGREFGGMLKVGRTQLQDAVPMMLGQEFMAFAAALDDDCTRLSEDRSLLWTINLGATAVGTGITAAPRYTDAVRAHLSAITDFDLRTARNLIAATSDMGDYMRLSGDLKRLAMKLSKMCNDLRLLASGPQFGFGEINLPQRQAGSSIMPGKVNPVIPEVVNEVAFVVAGFDTVVTMASEAGQLQLNAFGPVVANALLSSLTMLTAGINALRQHCIVGITANTARLAKQTQTFVGVITAFTPYIGYATAADLALTALATETSIAELIVESGLMAQADVQVVMDPARLAGEDLALAPAMAVPWR